jgi:hypothetical protein
MSSGTRIKRGIGDADVLSSDPRFYFRGICWRVSVVFRRLASFVVLLHLSCRLFQGFVFSLFSASRRWLGHFLGTNTHF